MTVSQLLVKRISMPSSAFEPAVSGILWPQTCALDRTANRIGQFTFLCPVTIISTIALIILLWRCVPGSSHYRGFTITHTHTHTPQSVGLLWMCDQPNA
jgi:hypothetical protein